MLDPFTGGAPRSESELRTRLRRVLPAADARRADLDHYLEPATPRQILARVLRNLKGIYRKTDKPERMLDVLNRMLLVVPESSEELRDRGLVYAGSSATGRRSPTCRLPAARARRARRDGGARQV